MSITFYHILHVTSLLLLSGVGFAMVFAENRKPFQKFYGILSFLVLLGGFGLMAKLGYTFKENAWMAGKLLIWVLLSAVIPILLKRSKLSQKNILAAFVVFLFLAVYFHNK